MSNTPKSEVTPEQRSAILLSRLASLANGTDWSALAFQREVPELVGELTPAQIRATAAHVKIKATTLAERTPHGLSGDDLIHAYFMIRAASDGNGGGGVGTPSRLTPQVAALTNDLEAALGLLPEHRVHPLERLSLPALQPLPDVLESQAVEEPDVVSGGDHEPVTGDMADYDFDAKRDWREAWLSYIVRHLTPAEIANAKVLCLPGRKVEPEVSLYLRIGIRPENILAVEGGCTAARAEFELNARRLGIQYRIGKLERIVPTLTEPFTIVNLDFHGQLTRTKLGILSDIPAAENCVLIVNVLGKRESSDAKDMAKHFTHGVRNRLPELLTSVAMGRNFDVDEFDGRAAGIALPDARAELISSLGVSLGQNRITDFCHLMERAFDRYWLQKCRGNDDPDLWAGMKNTPLYNIMGGELLMPHLAMAMPKVAFDAKRNHGARLFSGIDMSQVALITNRLIANSPLSGVTEPYRYISSVSDGNSPFESTFAYRTKSTPFKMNHMDTLKFFADFYGIRHGQGLTVQEFVTSQGRVLSRGEKLFPTHMLRIGSEGSPEKVTIQLGVLRQYCLSVQEYIKTNRLHAEVGSSVKFQTLESW